MTLQPPAPAGAVVSVAPPPATSRATVSPPSASSDAAATATISPWGELLSRLKRLHDADPALFKSAVEKLAKTAADAGGDDPAAAKKLAADLWHAAKTGDLSGLKPTTPTHALHPSHAHHARHFTKPVSGGTGALLENLLRQLDIVLGPNAPAPSSAGT